MPTAPVSSPIYGLDDVATSHFIRDENRLNFRRRAPAEIRPTTIMDPHFYRCCLLVLAGICFAGKPVSGADDFLVPFLTRNCSTCHNDDDENGDINIQQAIEGQHLRDNARLVSRLIDAIDSNFMPPEDEPQLDEATRARVLTALNEKLRQATAGQRPSRLPVRRLNRFQYNNSVKDLFQLNRNVFALPEKLMTRQQNYLLSIPQKLPDRVRVVSHALQPRPGLRDVESYPKDLRAAHGFDNQADQLTLSPLLLDAFLRLSVSIVESPDFNEQSVGIWKEFFQEPTADTDRSKDVKQRLERFLKVAFRGPVDTATLDRYAAFAVAELEQGRPFTDTMKKVASAALSSPMFLLRSTAANGNEAQYELASNLSFFLWSSCPDPELLRLADAGQLSRPEVLNDTIDRMLNDPKIERFLDSFPVQWMQLENLLAVTPDPEKNPYFSLDKRYPASLQMVLEPLLLFDTVFVEDRPVVELIAPSFSYRSEFLETWYTSDLKPPPVDVSGIVETNRRNDQRRKKLEARIEANRTELNSLIQTVKDRILAARENVEQKPADLKPLAAWEFEGDLKASVSSLDLTAHGKISFHNGMVVLDRAHLLSKPLTVDLRTKSLEVFCQVADLNQQGGGVMGIQGPGDFFDTIVLGERKPRHWISGSNRFSRTKDFPESTPESKVDRMLHLVMTYAEDGTITLYRDGRAYGKPYQSRLATFPKNKTSVIFGLRHLPPGGNKYLTVSIDRARLYDRALTADEVAAAATGTALFVSQDELHQSMTPAQIKQMAAIQLELEQATAALKKVPTNEDPGKVRANAARKFENQIRSQLRSPDFHRVKVADPRYGGVITNAAMLSMTSGPQRTHPIARGAWIIEVIFNDPPPPPPNDVPPLQEESSKDLTIRERFAAHRDNPSCAGCHSRIDPLGFALENFDVTGRWRDKYENGRRVDASGKLLRKHSFDGIVEFKASLAKERHRFAKAFTGHLLRFALARELVPADAIAINEIMAKTEEENFRIRSLIREVILDDSFLP